MRFYHELPAILAGTAIASAIVITVPSAAMALSGEQVNDIAREVTVLIKGERGHGSGAIVSKSGETYYVLTAHHVVAAKDKYKIVTSDKQAYELKNVKQLPGVDLAVVEFTSDKEYQVAKLTCCGNSWIRRY